MAFLFRNTLSNKYVAMLGLWNRCYSAVDGQDAIHNGRELFLPKLGGQSEDQYTSYINRTRFLAATGLTIEGMVGLVFDQLPKSEGSDEYIEWLKNVSSSGETMLDYQEALLTELLTTGWCGTLIDHSSTDEQKTLAQANADKDKPLWTLYKAERIQYWKHERISGNNILTEVILKESGDDDEIQYLVLSIIDGVYIQSLYEENGELIRENTPRINGKTFDYIPFYFHNTNAGTEPGKPPLLDLVDANIKYYQLKADHIHALHYVALPTPYIVGVDPDDEFAPSEIGPQKLWIIGEVSAKVGMLEFTGAGIVAIERELADIKVDMAQYGVRLLNPSVRQETATATTANNARQTSRLARIINNVNAQLEIMIDLTTEWLGTDGEYVLNTDFIPDGIDASMLGALVSAWQMGAYDYGTLFNKLKRGDIIENDISQDEMEASIEDEESERLLIESESLIQENENANNEDGE